MCVCLSRRHVTRFKFWVLAEARALSFFTKGGVVLPMHSCGSLGEVAQALELGHAKA